MDLSFLAQADNVTLKLELARSSLESAKNQFDAAKQAYDELLAQADNHGIPKAKLKKLTEDRVQALIESGLISGSTKLEGAPRPGAEAKRGKKAKPGAESEPTLEKAEEIDDREFQGGGAEERAEVLM